VSAHGTGFDIPTVEEQILELKIMTANGDIIICSKENNEELFNMAKVLIYLNLFII